MDNQSQRSFRMGMIGLVLAALLAIGFAVAARTGWIDVSQAQTHTIQAQGSSPYCLFAVTANLYGGDMWRLESEYHRRQRPTIDGFIPLARPVIDLAGELGYPMTIGVQWDTATIQATVQRQSVAVTGQKHALVLIGWRDGKITYLDSLHAGRTLTMTDQAFWAWWDGWGWWVDHE